MKSDRKSFEELSEESKKLYSILNEGIDLAVVLIGTSFLDTCLESLIRSYFKNPPSKKEDVLEKSVSTFSSRYMLAYCLGLIETNELEDLRIIGEIRNKFAHSFIELNFQNNEIENLCNSLKYLASYQFVKPEVRNSEGDNPLLKIVNTPREKFSLTVVIIFNNLILRGLRLKKAT